jgi:hypothetical protein
VPGPFEYSIWILCALLEAGVVVCSLLRRSFQRYFTLNLYMIASFATTVGRYVVLARSGFTSNEYAYFYYYSDAILTICLYFVLMGLYSLVFEELGAATYVRAFSMLLLAGTALFSYGVIHQSENRMVTLYVFEMSQNLYFVGLVLTYVLWGAVLKLRETRARVIQFVLSLGVYFSLYAANYALDNIYPNLDYIWMHLPGLISTLLPIAWCYAFLRFSENARLAPARLAVIPR